jgi:hypothetical protein
MPVLRTYVLQHDRDSSIVESTQFHPTPPHPIRERTNVTIAQQKATGNVAFDRFIAQILEYGGMC